MKKIAIIFILLLALVGCGDKGYIDAAKSMQLNQVLEIDNLKIATTGELAAYFIQKLTGYNYDEILKSMEYEVEGALDKNNKIIVATYVGAKVTIPVEKKGDYFFIEPAKMVGSYQGKKYGFPQLFQSIYEQELEKNLKNIFN